MVEQRWMIFVTLQTLIEWTIMVNRVSSLSPVKRLQYNSLYLINYYYFLVIKNLKLNLNYLKKMKVKHIMLTI
jgi:hypothetical protein